RHEVAVAVAGDRVGVAVAVIGRLLHPRRGGIDPELRAHGADAAKDVPEVQARDALTAVRHGQGVAARGRGRRRPAGLTDVLRQRVAPGLYAGERVRPSGVGEGRVLRGVEAAVLVGVEIDAPALQGRLAGVAGAVGVEVLEDGTLDGGQQAARLQHL